MGGENSSSPSWSVDFRGSSPRGRGKPAKWAQRLERARLIPAWAGKTGRTQQEGHRREAHPRVGGENSGIVSQASDALGSSPRGRGKRSGGVRHGLRGWLIPAWAGKTVAVDPALDVGRAHPRVGGENTVKKYQIDWVQGSSPRGRGKHTGNGCNDPRRGLIPAWAGKTLVSSSWPQHRGAHPRVGGENLTLCAGQLDAQGSSPRGRGKPRRDRDTRRLRGLIPAWAGKTY